ncbi:hypothetical protein VTL71DRAFT_12781 [Oculimacula yallundae]|uniref:Uncharacterized protein n=1 Tax=Oculimacula yallundae TaxID=86028 RepID=A0ABR4CNG0_9HELO
MTYNTTDPFPYSSQDSQPHKSRRASSDRLPQRISFKLVSLVSKFEALDSLSLSVSTTLHPAPLQGSTKPSTQKSHTRSNYRSRLSTIFSPRRGSLEKNEHELSEDEVQAAHADVFSSSRSGKTAWLDKSQDTRRLRKAQTIYKPSSTRSYGGVWGAIDVDFGTEIGSIAAPYIQNEVPDEKRRGSIRDRIKYYDGAVSTGDNTRANSSTINTAAPNTPVSVPRSRLLDKSYFLTPSTGSSKRTCSQAPDTDVFTPTRAHRTSNARQSLKFGRPTQNQSIAQSSPTWSAHSNVTSHTVKRTRPYRNGQDTSPSRVSIQRKRIPGPMREVPSAQVETKAYPASGIGGDGSVPPPLVGQDESDQLLSRRRLSSKIEELYRKKSMEKKGEDAQGSDKQQEATSSTAKVSKGQAFETKATESRPGKFAEITRTKVAAMRKLFDGKFSPRSATPEPCCGLDPILDTAASSPSPQDQTPESRLPTPSMPQAPTTPSPKTLPTEVEVKSWEAEQAPGVSELANVFETATARPSQSTSPIKKLSPAKSKFIEDKIKKFESVSERTQPSRGKIFRRRLSKSLRSLFEVSSRKSQEEGQEKSRPPVALLDTKRIQSPDGGSMATKRGAVVEKWNRPTAVSSQGDGTASERESVSPSAYEELESRETVVKSVECGLREPRPVRAVEMKRMALLCKDRVGGIMDRDKGRVSQRRKL